MFQEYRIESLDLDSGRDLVIERVLALGTRAEVRWLLSTYGRESVVAWLRRDAGRKLPRRRYVLWSIVLAGDVEPPPRTRPTGVWPH